jgi:NO-binding membrane sensor protein with MHYT domain
VSVAGTHDTALVALSILIATAASYTALDLAGRIRASSGWACHAWLATSALAMGGGIWSMHFVAMLAFSMPGMDVSYDVPLTALSLIVAILVTGIGLQAVSREKATPKILLFSGCFVGLGIVAMHYTGMAAMRMAAHVDYDTLWVAVSVLIAVGAATVALWLAFQNTGLVQKLVAAVAMGLAISGMHYSAMQAAIFTAHSAAGRAHGDANLAQTALDDDKSKALLENAVEGAERGAALTQRMLAFARRQDLDPQAVDVSALVRGMADLLQRSIGPMVRIETHFPLRLPPALVDANQLELALLNLVVNARDAMPDGGTITIAGHEEGSGRFIRLSVTDTGEGMDETTLARATEPFFTIKGTGKGTALGLSMVHGLAEQSGGGFALRSRKGEGTTAEIWLPLATAHMSLRPRRLSPRRRSRRLAGSPCSSSTMTRWSSRTRRRCWKTLDTPPCGLHPAPKRLECFAARTPSMSC